MTRSWLILGDNKITPANVFWDNNTDSIEMPAQADPAKGSDSISVTGLNLSKGYHTFNAITRDAKGNKSVTKSIVGRVNGALYQSRLVVSKKELKQINIKRNNGRPEGNDTIKPNK